MFVASVVLLCPIHVLRYFKDKVFTGKAYWGDAGDKNYLSGDEKEELMKLLASVRDAPSKDLFRRRETDLIEMIESLHYHLRKGIEDVLLAQKINLNMMTLSLNQINH